MQNLTFGLFQIEHHHGLGWKRCLQAAGLDGRAREGGRLHHSRLVERVVGVDGSRCEHAPSYNGWCSAGNLRRDGRKRYATERPA